MSSCDILIHNVQLFDGTGTEPQICDVAIDGDRILSIGALSGYNARSVVDGTAKALSPGFIDVHTHDDTSVIRTPQMLPKLSQGITTVITGNCGISAAPVTLKDEPFDPLNLLGTREAFRYPTFAAYVEAVSRARPAVNVAALVGHTSLRNNHMDRLDQVATDAEISAMRTQLAEALEHGAIGLSTGLAYLSANAATTEEVLQLAEPLAAAGAFYTTHLRSETASILDAMAEAFRIGSQSRVPVVISHLKCAGIDNWGRSGEVLRALESARVSQPVNCDCYPYAAGSSTLDLRQVDERVEILITWSDTHPEMGGKTLAAIAKEWELPQIEAAKRLQPAGAIYHSISEEDMRLILSHPATMIGSDGLPNDPLPHPRLWGAFPRVLGRYSRELQLFSMAEAVRKMTGLPAERFGLRERGLLREGYYADLVLFDPLSIADTATFIDPIRPAQGIAGVWVNGVLSYAGEQATGERNGRFLPKTSNTKS